MTQLFRVRLSRGRKGYLADVGNPFVYAILATTFRKGVRRGWRGYR